MRRAVYLLIVSLAVAEQEQPGRHRDPPFLPHRVQQPQFPAAEASRYQQMAQYVYVLPYGQQDRYGLTAAASQMQSPTPLQQQQQQQQLMYDGMLYQDRTPNLLQNPNLELLAHNHNYAGLLQKHAFYNVLPQSYVQPAPRTYALQIPALRYQTQVAARAPAPGPRYLVPQQSYSDLRYVVAGGQPFLMKRQPASLLDSYVPSVLQVQYLQQLRASYN